MGKNKPKKQHLFLWAILSFVVGAALVFNFAYRPMQAEMQQYQLAFHLMGELTWPEQTTVVDVWWENEGRPNIPVESLLITTADGFMHAVHPDGKVTKHLRSGAFLEVLPIKMPNGICRTKMEATPIK